METRSLSRLAKLGSALLITAISASFISFWPGNTSRAVEKGFKKTKENTRLDCTEIPAGNTVYFGKYNEKPIDFEIKAATTGDFGGTTLFLRSRNALFKRAFDANHNIWKDSSRYIYSDLYIYLNYYFIDDAFTTTEQEVIFKSVKKGGKAYDYHKQDFLNFVFEKSSGLEGDKIFVLDASEEGVKGAERKTSFQSAFSDFMDDWEVDNQHSYVGYKKNGEWRYYDFDMNAPSVVNGEGTWLRDRDVTSSRRVGVYYNDEGTLSDYADLKLGVKPGMNIDQYSILFYSNINPDVEFGKAYKIYSLVGKKTEEVKGAEYKLTLKDNNIDLSIPSGECVYADRNSITVPYDISGSNADSVNQLSVLILEDKLKDLNENKNSIKYYEPLQNCYSERDGSFIKNGTATIKLPPKYDIDKWGNDYHIYLLAENINGEKETDYASYMEIPRVEIDQGDDGSIVPVTPIPTVYPGVSGSINNAVIPASNVASNTNGSTDLPTGNRNGSTSANTLNNNTLKIGTINLDKARADVICGKILSLKVLGNEASSKVAWKSSDDKIATVDSNGTVKGKKAGSVTITANVNGKKATCALTVLYKDVTDCSKFWYEPTNVLTAKDVVKGYENQTKFKPANKCTRAQMVTFIWRLMGEPAPQTTKCKFKDVKQSDYFYKACIWGNEKGIVEGYKNGTFGPKIVCARRHAVTFLWRLAGKPSPKNKTNKFSDVKKSDYYYNATLWASEKNILAGYSDGTFRPNGDCLRRQMVTFLYKYDMYINS